MPNIISIKEAKSTYIYNHESGLIFKGGKEAKNTNLKGHLHITHDGILLKYHRLAWAIYYGEWPKDQIDHINGIRGDNRIANLRSVSNQENSKNRRRSSNNTSGYMGVSFHKGSRKWQSYICVDGKFIFLGKFADKEDAIIKRKTAERDYGFHQNHNRI